MQASRLILYAGLAAGIGTLSAGAILAGLPGSSGQSAGKPANDPCRPEHCVITAVSVEVPAQEAGLLKQILVREGQEVNEGDLLAQIDDTQAKAAKEVADYRLKAAEKEAGNDVSVRYAQAGFMVAETEYQQILDTLKRFERAVTAFERNRAWFKREEGRLGVEDAQHKLAIAAISKDVRAAEARAAAEDVQRRKIKSPTKGRVEKRHREPGEWVKPGDPVVQILRLDKVRVEGFMDATRLSPADVENRPVSVSVRVPGGQIEQFTGRVVFASYHINTKGQSVVRAEVENRNHAGQWILRPGMEAEMVIHRDGGP
ncbi:MAG: HlyD family secretion protein [Thermoguttaceae bacterium]